MVKFDYLPDGRIAGLRDVFTAFNEPSRPIPADVDHPHRHHDGNGCGAADRRAAVSAFVDYAVIVIAHNAGSTRKFAERYGLCSRRKAWGCSRPR